MSGESANPPPETPREDLPQDPGIPGWKRPEELPPQDAPDIDDVADAELPDYDEEGQMAPGGQDSTTA